VRAGKDDCGREEVAADENEERKGKREMGGREIPVSYEFFSLSLH
jgi:hypothetical protein